MENAIETPSDRSLAAAIDTASRKIEQHDRKRLNPPAGSRFPLPRSLAGLDIGLLILGFSTICFGIACFLQRDFTIFWQPVPEAFPLRQPLAYLSAGLLVLSGAGLFVSRTRRMAAILQICLFTLYAASWLPRLLGGPKPLGAVLGIAEHVAIVIGAATIVALCSARAGPPGALGRIAARIGFGCCSIVFGLSHIVGLQGTASLVPEWVPGSSEFWALFTGAAHIAVGLALFADRFVLLATRLAALMYLVFVAIVWAPGAFTHPDQWLRWAGAAISLVMMGAVWLVGDYLRAVRLAAGPARWVGP